MHIQTLPVYSKLADETEVEGLGLKLPEGWKLSQHQVETYRALTEGSYDVVFNTAMTGDGKSLAGQLPLLVKGGIHWTMMAMYPTNELIDDQYAHFESTKRQWGTEVEFGLLNRNKLDQVIAEEDYARRGQGLTDILRRNDLVLTNPDVFHYVMHQFYTIPLDAPDRYAAPLAQKFEQLTFDEFHIFDAPQVVSVLNALLFIREIEGTVRSGKFLFLSATPGELMQRYLKNAGLKVCEITGSYASSSSEKGWRKILNAADIEFVGEPRAEKWIEAHLEDTLLPFFLQRGAHAKGAIIVNSVASAHRILENVLPLFEKHGLNAALNTGMTSRSRRKVSYEADLLIGTSTVDVGVDFQINFLLFESRDAGSFLQRLGRLGRHPGYTRNGQFTAFQDYQAYALVPNWIGERLFKGKDGNMPLLSNGSEIERQQFNQAIQAVYPPTTSFDHYAQCWGKFQSIKILWGLERAPIREQYKETRQKLQSIYESAYGFPLSSSFKAFKELHKNLSPLLQDALSFRGGEEFPCYLIDETEPKEIERFKPADLLQLIANHHLSSLSEKEFFDAVAKAGLKRSAFENQGGSSPLGFFRLHGVLKERKDFEFFLDKDLLYWSADKFGAALELSGFRIDAAFPDGTAINRRLEQRKLPAILCANIQPLNMKQQLNLPFLFPLHKFTSRDGLKGTVAFGRTALMLHSRLIYTRLNSGGGAIII